MTTDLVLRATSTADAAAIVALTQAAYRQNHAETGLYGYVYEETPPSLLQSVHEAAGWLPLLLEDAGVPVGAVRVRWSYPNSVDLARLAVLPERHGSGLGGLLIQAVEDIAMHWGRSWVTLGVLEVSSRTQAWYERLGYEPWDRKEMSTAPGNFYTLMRKRIQRCKADGTVATYTAHAAEFAARFARIRSWTLESHAAFNEALAAPAKVLDLGCGNGRDTQWLHKKGYTVVPLDATLAMLHQFNFPTRVQADSRALPLPDASLDGVWASASLLHLPRLQIVMALLEIRRVLRENGVFQATLKIGHGEATTDDGRFFAFYQPDEILRMLIGAGFQIERHWRTPDERPMLPDWLTVIARRTNETALEVA